MRRRHCCICKEVNLPMHSFPTDLSMKARWCEIVFNAAETYVPCNLRVCTKHFEPMCYIYSGKKLKPSAVPTLFLNNSESQLSEPSVNEEWQSNTVSSSSIVADSTMVKCWAPGCEHTNQRNSCKFFRFPKDRKEILRFNKRLRGDIEPEPDAFVCSCHPQYNIGNKSVLLKPKKQTRHKSVSNKDVNTKAKPKNRIPDDYTPNLETPQPFNNTQSEGVFEAENYSATEPEKCDVEEVDQIEIFEPEIPNVELVNSTMDPLAATFKIDVEESCLTEPLMDNKNTVDIKSENIKSKDDNDIFGEFVAAQLKKISDDGVRQDAILEIHKMLHIPLRKT